MKFSILRFLPLLCAPFLLASCAKSPAGGPTNPVPNRLEVQLTMRQDINPNYYYGVAFDDIPSDGQGPIALEGNTTILNGVMGGQFRLLVLYNNTTGVRVFYRDNPADPATERVILSSVFVGAPQVTNTGLLFTLDLDARLDSSTYIFPRANASEQIGTDRLDVNFVTTNTIIRSPQDNRIKPVDAFGPATLSTPIEFQIGATRRSLNPDESNDRRLNVDPSFTGGAEAVNFGQIDVTELELNVTRS